MSIKGKLKASRLAVAQVTVDTLQSPVSIKASAAMIDDGGAGAVAWMQFTGNVWSDKTLGCLKALIASMEADIGKAVLESAATSDESSSVIGGLGEHLGRGAPEDDAESI